jgi:PST family polysaccharide transporter
MVSRFARGAVYVGTANWTNYAINFAIGIAVARILGPEEFGLYAFVLAVNEFINIVNGLGVAPALVQSREESEVRYDTGYAISFAQALAGLVAALVAAPFLVAHRSADAGWFIVLLALARFPLLLTDVVYARLNRQIRYGVIAASQFAGRSLPNLAGLGLALAGWGAWSLVLRDLMIGFLPFLIVHVWSGWWFRGQLSREAFRSIMSYSGPVFVARAVDTVVARLDRLAVGSLLGDRALGLYHQARFLADAGLVATTPVSQVTFNLYARLQDESPRLGRAFSLVNYFLVRVFFAASVVLIVAPNETLRLLLGEDWLAAAPVLQILGLYAGLATLLQNLQILLYARGLTFTLIRLRLVQLAVLAPGVLVAGFSGSPEGVAASVLGSTLLAVILGWLASRDVARGAAVRVFVAPIVALVVTVVAFRGLSPLASQLPFWVMPFLPPVLFAALLALIERGRLFDEVGYLRAQFGRPGGSARASRP